MPPRLFDDEEVRRQVRGDDGQITVFSSVGLAGTEVAVAAALCETPEG